MNKFIPHCFLASPTKQKNSKSPQGKGVNPPPSSPLQPPWPPVEQYNLSTRVRNSGNGFRELQRQTLAHYEREYLLARQHSTAPRCNGRARAASALPYGPILGSASRMLRPLRGAEAPHSKAPAADCCRSLVPERLFDPPMTVSSRHPM